MNNHSCLKIIPRATDWIKGVNSGITFKAVIPSGDWTSHIDYFERQKFVFDCDLCVIFDSNRDFDMQMDLMIQNGVFPATFLEWLTLNNYMDSANSLDSKPHFHTSPLATGILTGNGMKGNSQPNAWDVFRSSSLIPWLDMPFTAQTPISWPSETIPQTFLDKGKLFLSMLGGKNAIQYHFIVKNGPTNLPAINQARQQAPVGFGIPVNDAGWNQVIPPLATGTPVHAVSNYADCPQGENVVDNYDPFKKILQSAYEIPYAFQGIVSPIFPPPLPTPLPPNPTVQQESSWIQSVSNWIASILSQLQGRNNLGSTSMNYSILKSKTFWSAVVTIAYNFFATVVPLYPNVPWVSTVFDLLGMISVSYFHISGVQKAAVSSAALSTPSSGQ